MLITSELRNAAQELSGIPLIMSVTGSTTSTRLTVETRIQRRRHHRQQLQHIPRRQRQHLPRQHQPQQHQQWLPARTITISAKANQMGTTGTANARSTTRATSLEEP